MSAISELPVIPLEIFFEKIDEAKSTCELDLRGFCFDEKIFEALLSFLSQSPQLSHVRFSKALLKEVERRKILTIANGNLMKGVKLLDEEGQPLGNAYTDWHKYNESKKEVCLLNETTLIALSQFSSLPLRVIDFGAGTGQETVALLNQGCASVVAIDGDREAISILKNRAAKYIDEARLEVYEGPFLKYMPINQADLFLSSFTWPYRPSNDFAQCWEHSVICVKSGGWIAGHFFGAPNKPDPGMSYHTREQIIELLEENFEQATIKEEIAGERKIYGGEIPPWGILYHIVAKKKFKD